METLHLPLTNFIWCIGNHDIDRKLDSKYAEAGIAGKLTSLQAIDDFCSDKNNLRDIRRIEPFKSYEKSFYQSALGCNYKFGDFESCYKYQIRNIRFLAMQESYHCRLLERIKCFAVG